MANKARDFVAKFLTDTSKFDTDQPVKELDNLADAADTTARRMDDSFDRVRDSSKRNLDKVGEEGSSHAKAAGQEIGAEFAENIGEAFRSGDVGALVTESLTSLGPALGVVGIGIGLGAALITNAVKGIQKNKQLLTEATQRVIDNIDVDMSTFAAKFDVSKFLNESIDALTGGGLEQDIARFQELARNGVGEDTLTRILVGEATAEDRAKIAELASGPAKELKGSRGEIRTIQTEQQKQAEDLLVLLNQQVAAIDRGKDAVNTLTDAQKIYAGWVQTSNGLLDQQSAKALGNFQGKKLPTDDR